MAMGMAARLPAFLVLGAHGAHSATATATPSWTWTLDWGDCQVDGACLQSPNYPGNYPPSRSCGFSLSSSSSSSSSSLGAVTLTATHFDTEAGEDKLRIDSEYFSGPSSNSSIRDAISRFAGRHLIDERTSFYWSANGEVEGTGWRLCAGRPQARPGEQCFWEGASAGAGAAAAGDGAGAGAASGGPPCDGNARCPWCGASDWYCCEASTAAVDSVASKDETEICNLVDHFGDGDGDGDGGSHGDGYKCARLNHAQCVLETRLALKAAFETVVGGPWDEGDKGALWTFGHRHGLMSGLRELGRYKHPQTMLRSRPFVVTNSTRISVQTKGDCPSPSQTPSVVGSDATVSGDATVTGFLGVALQDTSTGKWVAQRSRTCRRFTYWDHVEKLKFSPADLSEHLGKVLTLDIVDANSAGSIAALLPWQNFLGNGSTCQSQTWDGDLRLRGTGTSPTPIPTPTPSPSPLSGLLEIYHLRRWRAVAAKWRPDNQSLAAAACAQLGFAEWRAEMRLEGEAADAWLEVKECADHASALWECMSGEFGEPLLWGAVHDEARAVHLTCKEKPKQPPEWLPWDVVRGPCVRHGACITSSGFPAHYASGEKCLLKVYHPDLPLVVKYFDTEDTWDTLTIDNSDYSGSIATFGDHAPPSSLTARKTHIAWQTDFQKEGSGWKLCANLPLEVVAADLSGDGDSFALDTDAWRQMLGEEPQPGSGYVIRQERSGSSVWTGEVIVDVAAAEGEDKVRALQVKDPEQARGLGQGQGEGRGRVLMTMTPASTSTSTSTSRPLRVRRAEGAAAGQWQAGDKISLTHDRPCPCKLPFTWVGVQHRGCTWGGGLPYPWCRNTEAEATSASLNGEAEEGAEVMSCFDTTCPIEATTTTTTTTSTSTWVFDKCLRTRGCYTDNAQCLALRTKASDCLNYDEHSVGSEECTAWEPPGTLRFASSRLEPFLITMAVLLLFALLYGADKLWQRRQLRESRRAVDNATAQSLAVAVGRYFLPSHSVNTHQFRGMMPAEATVAIKFDELGLRLRDGRSVLEGVSGEFQATHLVAIMGPSGAGKTTFMNVLAGRATYGAMTGKVWFNGKEVDPVKLRPSFGFVPQDDVVHPRLTVRENLLFSAWLRNPGGTPRSVINDIVDDALAVLQIGHVQSSLVGSVEERGISGGQRKRVNIGWELVACPSLLYLDEPTSGLDSTTSLQIINSLRKMTELNMTICMVIHQPRYQLFTLFDDVLLLGPGGRTVYLGPSQRTAAYFEGLGYQMPERENAADWFMDVLSGAEPHPTLPDFKPSMLFEKWRERGASTTSDKVPRRLATQAEQNSIVESVLQEEWSKVDTDNSGHLDKKELVLLLERCGVRNPEDKGVEDLLRRISADGQRVLFSDLLAYIIGMTSVVAVDKEAERSASLRRLGRGTSDSDRQTQAQATDDDSNAGTALLSSEKGVKGVQAAQRPNVLLQLAVLVVRRFVQFFRETHQRMVDLGLAVLCACVIGILQKGKLHVGSSEFATLLGTCHMGLALLTAASSLKVFGADRAIFWRESGSGLSVLAYMLAKVFGNVFDLLFQSSLYILVYFYIVKPEGPYSFFWFPCLLLSLVAASWGYFISAVLPPQNAMICAVIFMLILCGIFGNAAKFPDRLGEEHTFMEVVVMISISRWSMPITFLSEMRRAHMAGRCTDTVLDNLDNSLNTAVFVLDGVAVLLVMSLLLHIACYLGLRFLNRDKQV